MHLDTVRQRERTGALVARPSKVTPAATIVAIPCFNTGGFISDVVSRARKHVDQVIVIDDGSHDGTAERAKAAGATVVSHAKNRGYGGAIRTCFEAAKANGAGVLAVLDGDGQHNPDELPQVLAPIIAGEADMVIGSRFLDRKTNMPRYRKFGIDVITFLCNFGSNVGVSDAQSGFRAYSARVVDALSLRESEMAISVEILIKARERGFNIKEVPISCLYHSNSSSLNPVVHGLSVAISVVKLRIKNRLAARMGRG